MLLFHNACHCCDDGDDENDDDYEDDNDPNWCLSLLGISDYQWWHDASMMVI